MHAVSRRGVKLGARGVLQHQVRVLAGQVQRVLAAQVLDDLLDRRLGGVIHARRRHPGADTARKALSQPRQDRAV